MARIFGYIRVSSIDQNESRQLVAMAKQGIPESRIFIEKKSGKDFSRPGYQAMLRKMRHGDVLCVSSIDRLGRNYKEIQEQWHNLTREKGIDIVVLDMPLLDTRREKNLLGTFIADLVLQVLSFVAQTERENIHSRQAEGIAAALARGVRFGRKARPLPDNFHGAFRLWTDKKLTATQAARQCGMPLSTFLYRARKYEGAEQACGEELPQEMH